MDTSVLRKLSLLTPALLIDCYLYTEQVQFDATCAHITAMMSSANEVVTLEHAVPVNEKVTFLSTKMIAYTRCSLLLQ